MPKIDHHIPFEEGSLKEIAEIFLVPIIKAKPLNLNLHIWLDECFGVEERIIKRFVAVRAFKMPGLFFLAPSKTEERAARGHREIKAGQELWARLEKSKIWIESHPKHYDEETYSLNPYEFRKIIFNLKEKPFRERKRDRLTWLKLAPPI